MQEYLFRGKSILADSPKSKGPWLYGNLIIQTLTQYGEPVKVYHIVNRELNGEIEMNEYTEVWPETVGQYTGMDDISGVKVFTDDIIKYALNGPYSGPDYRLTKVGPVIFSEYCFMPLTFCIPESVIIIGNIHDNPELRIKK